MMMKKIAIGMFSLIFAFSIVFGMIPMPNTLENSPAGILSSDEPRERWHKETHHKRCYLEADRDNLYRRAGEVVGYKMNVINLEANSLRVFFEDVEIPCEYNSLTDLLVFVVPKILDSVDPTALFTIYYDLVANGVKQAPNMEPEWFSDTAAFLEDGSVDSGIEHRVDGGYYYNDTIYYLNGNAYYNSSVYEEDGIYYYNGREVYQVGSVWYYYNGTAIENSYYINQFGEDVFQGGLIEGRLLDVVSEEDTTYDEWQIGNVKATGRGLTKWRDSDGTIITQNMDITSYRNSPDMKFSFSNLESNTDKFWGSALLDLNGTINYNGTILDRFNATEYIYNETDSDPSVKNTRLKVVTEDTIIDPEDLDFATDGIVMGSPTVDTYDRGFGQILDFSYVSGTSLYGLGSSQVLSITKVEGSVSGIITGWTLLQNAPDLIYLPTASDGELITVYYMVKRYASPGDELRVIPIHLNSKYIALHDRHTGDSAALIFSKDFAFNSILIEVWEDKRGGNVRYYVNVSFNYNYWWNQIPVPSIPIHDIMDFDFDMMLSYLDGVDLTQVKPIVDTILTRLQGVNLDVKKNLIKVEDPLPIKVKIHSPQKNQKFNGQNVKVLVNVTVEGETLGSLYVRYNGKNLKFQGTTNIWVDWADTPHTGTRGAMEANVTDDGNHGMDLYIDAVDTNGTIITEGTFITFDFTDPTVMWICLGAGGGAVALVLALYVAKKKGMILKGRAPGKATYAKLKW